MRRVSIRNARITWPRERSSTLAVIPSHKLVKGFCKVEPEHEYLGNARHYFGEMAQAKNLRPGEDSAISTYLNCLKQKLKLRIENMEIGFKKQLTDHDKSKAGLIRKLDLTYILIEVCKTPEP